MVWKVRGRMDSDVMSEEKTEVSAQKLKCQRCLEDIKKLILSQLVLHGIGNLSYLPDHKISCQFSVIDFIKLSSTIVPTEFTGGRQHFLCNRPPEASHVYPLEQGQHWFHSGPHQKQHGKFYPIFLRRRLRIEGDSKFTRVNFKRKRIFILNGKSCWFGC